MHYYPELLRFSDGKEVATIEDFKKRREEMLKILSENLYGYYPPAPQSVRYEVTSDKCDECAGHGRKREITITFDTEKGDFSFPVTLITPAQLEKAPLFLFINFNQSIYNHYYPLEEITDQGFGVCYVYFNNITNDDFDMNDKLAGMYNRPSDGTGYGKISLWAFALSKVLDCLWNFDDIDKENIAVIGHSRLGKTALWCGANDERIKYVISNDSGCCGAAYEREKHGTSETLRAIYDRFPYWFCENMNKFADTPDSRPCDQHFLLACSSPRYVIVGSADADEWADPFSEKLCCDAASPAFELFGVKGYTGNIDETQAPYSTSEGHILYHLREGKHFLSRSDWNEYIKQIKPLLNYK